LRSLTAGLSGWKHPVAHRVKAPETEVTATQVRGTTVHHRPWRWWWP